jgi:hypothetical protein
MQLKNEFGPVFRNILILFLMAGPYRFEPAFEPSGVMGKEAVRQHEISVSTLNQLIQCMGPKRTKHKDFQCVYRVYIIGSSVCFRDCLATDFW